MFHFYQKCCTEAKEIAKYVVLKRLCIDLGHNNKYMIATDQERKGSSERAEKDREKTNQKRSVKTKLQDEMNAGTYIPTGAGTLDIQRSLMFEAR
jgi:hypothetical protein